MDSELIDLCSKYISDKECSYLAKEGCIVRYMSTIGSKETLRIIRALRLTSSQAKELKENHLISDFQELCLVYGS